MAKARATVLFSGGIDSTSCVHFLRKDGYQVSGLFVDFGQAAARMERQSVIALSEEISIPINTLEVSRSDDFGAGELAGRNAFLIFAALLLGRCPEGIIALGIHAGTPY